MTTKLEKEITVSKDRIVPYVKGVYDLTGFFVVGNRDVEDNEEDLAISHIFLEDEKPIGIAILRVEDSELYIDYMEAIEQRKGYGTRMVTLMKNLDEDCATIAGESGHRLREFWGRNGAVYDGETDYSFSIDLQEQIATDTMQVYEDSKRG